MEMEKSYYVVTFKPAFLHLLMETGSRPDGPAEVTEETSAQRVIVSITQGGFGQDVVDDERQVKERFLEYLFLSSDLDLARTPDVFDRYFEMEQADELIDLDEEQ